MSRWRTLRVRASYMLKSFLFTIMIAPYALTFKFYRKYIKKKRRYRSDWSDFENY